MIGQNIAPDVGLVATVAKALKKLDDKNILLGFRYVASKYVNWNDVKKALEVNS